MKRSNTTLPGGSQDVLLSLQKSPKLSEVSCGLENASAVFIIAWCSDSVPIVQPLTEALAASSFTKQVPYLKQAIDLLSVPD